MSLLMLIQAKRRQWDTSIPLTRFVHQRVSLRVVIYMLKVGSNTVQVLMTGMAIHASWPETAENTVVPIDTIGQHVLLITCPI